MDNKLIVKKILLDTLYYFLLGIIGATILNLSPALVTFKLKFTNFIYNGFADFLIIIFLSILVFRITYNFKTNLCILRDVLRYILHIYLFLAPLFINVMCKNVIIIYTVIVIILVFLHVEIAKDDNKEDNLYKKRKVDLERTIEEIKHNTTVGVDSEWGSGKTFLVDKLCENLINTGNGIIKVDVLSYKDRDELRSFLLDQIEIILKENKIYPSSIRNLKKYLNCIKDKYKFNIVELFNLKTKENFNNVLKNYGENISNLEKDIIIVLDDLDRLSDTEKIKNILGFLYDIIQVNNKRIKVIFLYDQSNFSNNGISEEYLDKFIKTKFSLSKLSLKDILLEETNNDNYFNNICKELISILDFSKIIDNLEIVLENTELDIGACNKYIEDYIKYKGYFGNPRKVNKFTTTIKQRIKSNLYKDINKDNIVAFTFVETFLKDTFNTLKENSLSENLLEQYFLESENKNKTNNEALFLRIIFKYKYNFTDNVKIEFSNIKINKDIYKLFNLNASNITAIEKAHKIIDKEFRKNLSNDEIYNNINKELIGIENLWYIGENIFKLIKRILNVLEKNDEFQEVFKVYIDLIFLAYEKEDISFYNLFESLNYNRVLSSKELFYRIINKFVNLKKYKKIEAELFKDLLINIFKYWKQHSLIVISYSNFQLSGMIKNIQKDYCKNKSIRYDIDNLKNKNNLFNEIFQEEKNEILLFNKFLDTMEKIYDNQEFSKCTSSIKFKVTVDRSEEYKELLKEIETMNSNEQSIKIKEKIIEINKLHEKIQLNKVFNKRMNELNLY